MITLINGHTLANSESEREPHGDVVEIHPDYVDAVIEGLRREKDEFISLGLIPGEPDPDDEAT